MSLGRFNPSRFGFEVGMPVRVRRQVRDPDYPELPLGGWRGEIIDSQGRPNRNYLVLWSRETLANIHPIYREQCERDDVCFEQAWLFAEDLEPDHGGPLSIEHPMIDEAYAQEACCS